MRRSLPVVIVFALLCARAQECTDRHLAAGVAEFNAAYQAWDGSRFRAAVAQFHQAASNAPTSSLVFYWLGTAEFHSMLHWQTLDPAPTPKSSADASRDAALAALSRAIKLDERHAESHALLGTLYGMKIGGNLLRAARYGPRVQKHCRKALELDSDNPRVRYLIGTCQFHTAKTPADRREALASFLTADRLFAAEAKRSVEPLQPRWGRSSCRTFLGRAYESLGQRREAADAYRRALDEHPADHWAQKGLARVTLDSEDTHE